MSSAAYRATRDSTTSIGIWRDEFRIGEVYLNNYNVHASDRGWYATQYCKAGRPSRQRRPSATPDAAALKMWGAAARDAVKASEQEPA